MTIRRTTIELDDELVRAAQATTGDTVRGTVEEALRRLVAAAEEEREARRRRIADHLARAGSAVDTEALLGDEAWR
ncbi:type II toxin-antitoxin system VapB family antitoxin [Mycolicibacterium brumae]|uniref:DUF2191 domain-containing protein n=1 Tax=Mycolicibacterium brumae TaxID=85968 RepID=A0A2G5PEP5_9MYCO|nr:type II toxin-antitoxin system VapB family antitoxin [Mycolicibacterium brumae]MCV7192664.1 type II toxin-antitoxin system VapB family antitoxin [Mycolicibacterium brumae]PIB76590.1 DUF2191 domain-containing protein [Mycolicibacterium brumae]RWA23248.1 hypothetical protein MBRU_00080 [Mycolicibacterium brumae DSM 44177]UWW08821.1 type II toxin-antitoxin system VapB family antitoxin [Mycolicibacterium brumae]